MAEETGISWTDATFNPWIGCQAVSCACDHCYAETLVKRWGGDFSVRRRTAPANWKKPLAWDKKAKAAGKRLRVFCASLADVFDNQVPEEWRQELWGLIYCTPNLDWQLLTKRPQNIAKMLPAQWGIGWDNVWLGTTVENQEEANRRIPHLLDVPARIHFLSCEPLLGPVSLRAWMCLPYADDGTAWNKGNIDWVICGGESGHGARSMELSWAQSLLTQCAAASTPAWFKQTGSNRPSVGYQGYEITGKGDDPAQWPESLRVQEMPG